MDAFPFKHRWTNWESFLKTGGHHIIGGQGDVPLCEVHLRPFRGISRWALAFEAYMFHGWTSNHVHTPADALRMRTSKQGVRSADAAAPVV